MGRKMEVEQTNKAWKIVFAASILMVIGGTLAVLWRLCGVVTGWEHDASYLVPGLVVFGGIVGIIVAKIGAWWDNR